jgi:methanogenic corrinoid protein MtbC1
LYSLEDVCLKLITPALVTIGQGWHDGTVSVGQEHFATQFVRRKIQGLLSIYDVVAGQATIVAACAPGEQHDVGLLIVALLLVRRGYRVIYLGADVPLTGVLPVVDQVGADLVCLSTVTPATAPAAQQVAEALHRTPHPPLVVVGGDGADAIGAESVAYVRIEGDARAAVDQITALIAAHRSATRQD